jgi:hypothetical protein
LQKKALARRLADAWLLFCSDLTDDSEVSKAKPQSGMKSGPVHDTGIYHMLMNYVKKTFMLLRSPKIGQSLPGKDGNVELCVVVLLETTSLSEDYMPYPLGLNKIQDARTQ